MIPWRRCCLSPISSHVMCWFTILIEISNARVSCTPLGGKQRHQLQPLFVQSLVFCVFFCFFQIESTYMCKNSIPKCKSSTPQNWRLISFCISNKNSQGFLLAFALTGFPVGPGRLGVKHPGCKSRHVLGKLAPRLFFSNSQAGGPKDGLVAGGWLSIHFFLLGKYLFFLALGASSSSSSSSSRPKALRQYNKG